MELTQDLISQFVKATKDTEKQKTETIVYGTAVIQNNTVYVKMDGSDILTPAVATADTKDGERVTVMIKNHTAVITGNISSPAARKGDIEEVVEASADYKQIKQTVDTLVAELADANNDIDNLQKSVATTNTTVKSLDLKVTGFENDLADHDLTIAEHEREILSLQITVQSINTQLQQIAADIEDIKSRLV